MSLEYITLISVELQLKFKTSTSSPVFFYKFRETYKVDFVISFSRLNWTPLLLFHLFSSLVY